MPQSPFPISEDLTAISVVYKNKGYIADEALPRVTVGKQQFTFMQYPTDLFFNIMDTRVGRRSKPNEVVAEASELTDSTEDHALDAGVPQADIDNADARYRPLDIATMQLTELVALGREQRAVNIVHNAASYPSGLKETLSGTSQFSDFTNSTPIAKISGALDIPLVRPNQMIFSRPGWTKFRAHPEIVEAVLGTAASKGLVSRQAVADLFEVDEVLVGDARANAAKRGQTANLTRLWGKHIALLHKAPVLSGQGEVTFGATFQWGSRIAGSEYDKDIGMRGGQRVRVGESVKERVIATQAGYFFENAFA